MGLSETTVQKSPESDKWLTLIYKKTDWKEQNSSANSSFVITSVMM